MTKFLTAVGAAVFILPAAFGLLLLNIMWRTWWLYPAWGWYIEPLGVPKITFWHFAALMLFIGVLTKRTETKKDDRPENPGAWSIIFVGPPLTWIFLWWMARQI